MTSPSHTFIFTLTALQGQSGASDSQPVSMFSYLKNLPLTIQTRVYRVVFVVCHFSDHKCKHGNVYTA